MTTVEALKDLYVALGGDADDFNATTNPEAVELIASVVATAIAAELPEVTASDNGKVLKVVDGEWDVAEDEVE